VASAKASLLCEKCPMRRPGESCLFLGDPDKRYEWAKEWYAKYGSSVEPYYDEPLPYNSEVVPSPKVVRHDHRKDIRKKAKEYIDFEAGI
jgi:hypothetical protein